jgi:hypothetical protein
MNVTEKHLEEVTASKLKQYADDSDNFIRYAESSGKLGYAIIGVNGKGQFVTKHRRNDVVVHESAEAAVDEYTRLISQA